MPPPLREAGPADGPAIAALHLASWRDAYRGALADEFLDGPAEDILAGHWREVFAGPKREGVVLLAEGEEGLAGFVAAWRDGRACYVDNLHVRPGLRGGGLGRLLLGAAARRMQAAGMAEAYLKLFAANTGAIRFYARLGAEIGPEEMRHTFGTPAAERRAHWPDIATLVAACGVEAPG